MLRKHRSAGLLSSLIFHARSLPLRPTSSLRPSISVPNTTTADVKAASGSFTSPTHLGNQASTTKSMESATAFRSRHQITIKGASAADFDPFAEFHETPFAPRLKNVFLNENYVNPTPIQAQTWPIILANRDVISIARTGSGKTCGFILPAIHRILDRKAPQPAGQKRWMRHRNPAVLIVAPTRELSLQILEEAVKYANAVDLNATCVYGGASKYQQIKALQAGVDIVVGTPGRINDLIGDGALNLRDVHYLVLDEADRMLDMGFEPQIRAIVDQLPASPARQTIFFSATWPKEVQLLALDFVSDPVLITAGETNSLNANAAIQQHVSVVSAQQKNQAFMELVLRLREESSVAAAASTSSSSTSSSPQLLQRSKMPKTIVFMARKIDCDEMADNLRAEGVPADSIHGDLSQEKRSRTLDRFRRGSVRVLVATDVAARGLDVKDVEVVINYDFPSSGLEDYVHRIGRTARGENSGRSYSFLTSEDQRLAKDLISLLQRSKQIVPPELEALARNQGRGGNSGNQMTSSRSMSRYSDRSGSQRPRESAGNPWNSYSDRRQPSRPVYGERYGDRRPAPAVEEEDWEDRIRSRGRPRGVSAVESFSSSSSGRRAVMPRHEEYGRRRSSRDQDEDFDE
jgi:ATP-dependent RNA helicase DDX5/DBP2